MSRSFILKTSKILSKDSPASHASLLKALVKNITPDSHHLFNDNLVADMVQSHSELSEAHISGEPQLRLYCPISKLNKLRKTVIDVVSDDMAFLVDSIVAEINRHNLLIDYVLHPVLYVKYDNKGKLEDVSEKNKSGYKAKSHIHIHIRETVSQSKLENLEQGLREVLSDVVISNKDWPEMLQKLQEAKNELLHEHQNIKEIEEYAAFLNYLYDNNFTLLGYREYKFTYSKDRVQSHILAETGLGLLRDQDERVYINRNEKGLSQELQKLRISMPIVAVSKTNRQATVHRRVPMDVVSVKSYDDKGKVVGEKVFIGLFTSVTYSRSVTDVPFLREKIERVMALSQFTPASHDYKALRHILEKYPRDELFQIDDKHMLETGLSILALQERQRIALFMRRDLFQRYISCLIYVPRDRFGTDLRKKMGSILENELSGKISGFKTSLDDSVFAHVMFIIEVDQDNPPQFDESEIQEKLRHAGRTWPERLSRALEKYYADYGDITNFTLKYGNAFPLEYTLHYNAKNAVHDICHLEKVQETGRLRVEIYEDKAASGPDILKIKVFNPQHPLTLSDVIPIFEKMGLKAISELPFKIKPEGCTFPIWVHDFLVHLPIEVDVELEQVKEIFEEGFTKIWYGDAENDNLNRLILWASTHWRDVVLLRTYVGYLKQIRFPYGRETVIKAITQNADIAKLIVKYFKTLHDPEGQNNEDDADKISRKIKSKLQAVDSLEQDKILRTLKTLVSLTLRTNFFQKDEHGNHKSYLSIKLDSSSAEDLPAPRPYREIYVYSRRMEGIHLRGDKIARGGIRWSDRHEDYRTEILGLMKAQMVKNSVIVPMGAKGGFIVKHPPVGGDRQAVYEEGVECYRLLVRGLLDITDNRQGKKVIHPKNVVRRDGDDPYLVVAADKGTAKFSDIANALSKEYGFWLGDAFASGGSNGYDHKEMGITARGAWESVKLHFRQLNHNTQEEDFDVIGVGDMGGDVFGNGMILSEHIKLVGAFNHLHIFCDPNPDPSKTFKERKRLFENVMGWDQYDESLLSKGGKIFSRHEKTLKLTPEIMERFDITSNTVTPNDLMKAMLMARTDLLWFGGIGTYIKSVHESHADVGDKSNNDIRVNGMNVRAKVIGEGANLGITQYGRIEMAKRGIKLNTDFIDNSGGVDCSDHEVNIKILLTDVMRDDAHKMDLKARNVLLEKMKESVAQKVIANNYQQAQAISLTMFDAGKQLSQHQSFIRYLERESGLNRAIEALPDQEEIEERLATGKGLTRPEIATLVSYAKTTFTKALLETNAPDQDYTQEWAVRYFPEALQKKYGKEIQSHRLRREIIAMRIANSLVNRMGPEFVHEMREQTNENVVCIAKSYIIILDVFDVRDLWEQIEELDYKVLADVQFQAFTEVISMARKGMLWFLNTFKGISLSHEEIRFYCEQVAELRKNWSKVISAEQREKTALRQKRWVDVGFPEDLAVQMSYAPGYISACDIVKLSKDKKTDLLKTASLYFEIGEYMKLPWLRKKIRHMNAESAWQKSAQLALTNQLYAIQNSMTAKIISEIGMSKDKKQNATSLEKWVEQNAANLEDLPKFYAELEEEGTVDFAMLTIAIQKLSALLNI